jgi:aminocarboxymuconate-semialdehyde decarboxylase
MNTTRRTFLSSLVAVGGLSGFGPFAASAQPRPRKPAGKPVIDAHFHWYPPTFIDLVVKEGAAHGATIKGPDDSGTYRVQTPGGEFYSPGGSSFRKEMADLDAIFKAMDERGVDMYALTMTHPHVYWAPPAFGAKLSRAVNDDHAAVHLKHPTKLLGTIMLPMQDPKLALEELDRAAQLPGMRALSVAENIKGKNLSDKSFWPIWARCEQLGLPLFLKNVNPISERMIENDFSMINILGNPFEATMAITALILGGVMDAFPKLDVYVPHAGGAFPWLVPRVDYAISRGQVKHPRPASEYLRRFHYDLILHSPKLMRTLIDIVGVDRIVCGTDFPQTMSIRRPIEYVDAIPGITPRERERILCENPARLLKVNG